MFNQRGFSFFGLMVLVIFMASAGSIVMLTLESTQSNQRMDETIKKMDRLIAAIAAYRADEATGTRPPTIAYLSTNVGPVACTANTVTSKLNGWCGPYLDAIFQEDSNEYITDGWNTSFEYVNTGTLRSWGPNKTNDAGGVDDITRTF